MLARLIATHSRHLRHLSTTLSPHFHPSPLPPLLSPQIPQFHSTSFIIRHFSTNGNGNNGDYSSKLNSDVWKIAQEENDLDDIFNTHDGNLTRSNEEVVSESKISEEKTWAISQSGNDRVEDVFEEPEVKDSGGVDGKWSPTAEIEPWKLGEEGKVDDVFEESGVKDSTGVDGRWWPTAEIEPWKLGEEKKVEDVFGIDGESIIGDEAGEGDEAGKVDEMVIAAKKLELEKEEKALMEVLNGPNRAFGDLVAASGITDAMLDSLIALKDFQDIDGLPPLSQIEDERYEKTLRKSTRYEMELQKQEEAARSRVRQVDEKGRAYGTGKRKCSIARVWIQPGEGQFLINDKQFDVYFPMLDHRAALLRPFSETRTLGLWDVKCTVKGGGTTGQVDVIRLGISRALQNWEPGLRPPLREAGFLTRDSRIVERKKPGKAKARKSFQWVKR